MLRRLNLDGDQQADLTVHGGRAKAVYATRPSTMNSGAASSRGPRCLGMFGENLTTEGLREGEACLSIRIGGGCRGQSASHALLQARHPFRTTGHRAAIPGERPLRHLLSRKVS
jgi:MOSC domain-containing protein YiiM